MTEGKPKIGAYVRVSTGKQETQAQRHRMRESARANHVPASEVRWYEDKRTGTTTDRDALKRLLWAVDKGRVHTVVVFRLDRLARNLRDGLAMLADVADRGIRVVSVSENIDFGNSTGRLIASILLAVASFERETIVERIKAGMEAAKANGKHVRRPRNEKRLQRIRNMRDDGMTVNNIAARLECSRQAIYQALGKTTCSG